MITACITTTGCTDKKAPPTDSTTIDSMQKDSTSADTMEALMIEQPMPKAADELFDDFFLTLQQIGNYNVNEFIFLCQYIQMGKSLKRLQRMNGR